MKKLRIFGALTAVVLGVTMFPVTATAAKVGDTLRVGNGNGDQHREPNVDGYSYEIWLDGRMGGSGSMTLGSGATFNTEWSATGNQGNFLARRGKTYGSTKKATDYGTIVMDYAAQYNAQGGNSRLCVYGWFDDPMVEYYIIEDWKNWRPTGNSQTVTIDGAQYEIFQLSHNGPDIHGGVSTFQQYFSVRKQTRNSGTITVTDHFNAWAKAGWRIGNLYEIALNVEGWESSGSAKVTKLTLSDGGPTSATQQSGTTATQETKGPGSDGYYFKSSFDSGKDGWGARGTASVAQDTSNYCEGSGSLAVTGRDQDWCGAGYALDTSSFVPGNSYSFYTAVMQNTSSSQAFKMSLEYVDSDGQKHYDEVATATASQGSWTVLGNDSFKIPSGASDLLLYVETPDSTMDFFMDSASAAKSGTKANINVSGGKTVTTQSTQGTQGTQGTKSTGSYGDYRDHQNNDYTYTQGGKGFKDIMGPYFRLGTSVSGYEITDPNAQAFIKQNYNSITCENEMKPDQIIKGINGSNVNVSLSGAANQLKFAEQNGIGVRGHTFIWHSQTPGGMYQGDKATSDARIENFVKSTFDQLKSQYPNLKLYAYDVANEVFKNDGGGLRVRNGGGNDTSQWTNVYGENNDGHIFAGFRAARKYAPATCKLYLNDYNEYVPAKCENLCDMAKKLDKEGLIDGIGMQSHLDASYPDKNTYESAVKKFIALGLDVQITELDITNNKGGDQRGLWKDIFTVAMTNAEHISSLTMWGTYDAKSWRASQGGPLLFTGYNQPKAAYKEQQFALYVVVGQHALFSFYRFDVLFAEGVDGAVFLFPCLGFHLAVIYLVTHILRCEGVHSVYHQVDWF